MVLSSTIQLYVYLDLYIYRRNVDSSACLKGMDDEFEQKALLRDGVSFFFYYFKHQILKLLEA